MNYLSRGKANVLGLYGGVRRHSHKANNFHYEHVEARREACNVWRTAGSMGDNSNGSCCCCCCCFLYQCRRAALFAHQMPDNSSNNDNDNGTTNDDDYDDAIYSMSLVRWQVDCLLTFIIDLVLLPLRK